MAQCETITLIPGHLGSQEGAPHQKEVRDAAGRQDVSPGEAGQ